MSGVGLALSMAGMAALSLGMNKHHEQVFGGISTTRRTGLFRLLGWLLLALAVIPCVHLYGISIGLATWAAELTMAALVTMLLISYKPRLLLWLTTACAVFAALFAVL